MRHLILILLMLPLTAVAKDSAKNKMKKDKMSVEVMENKNLENFDDLDFNVFSNQKWQDLHKSHAKDIVVHWPDGRTTNGIDTHIEDLKFMFTYAPDTKIKEHPIKVAREDWTAVVGIMEGTFSQPMKMPDGKVVQPTGKKFKLSMSTFGHWKDGVMDEEYLFWDNAAFMKQIGAQPEQKP